MKKIQTKIVLLSLITLVVLAGAFQESYARGSSIFDKQTPLDLDQIIYLPLVTNGNRFQSPFGLEITGLDTRMLNHTSNLGTKWVRANAFSWKDIEPTRNNPTVPEYHWEVVNEAYLLGLSARNITVIATIKYTPEWAQKIEGYACGPVAEDKLDEYAQFVQALVQRYSVPPFNIKYWEFGNEPDVDPIYVLPNSKIGCWGDEEDYYNGGQYYATMLQNVYPAIKAIDPNAKVVIGGLLLDCEPDQPHPSNGICRSGRFFEGILENGGGANFDVVSFHAYAFYYSGTGFTGIVDENFPTWELRGGIVLGKIDFLREVMAEYGVSKPLLLSEAGLRCPWYYEGNTACSPPTSEFYNRQADYVVWLYARNWGQDILSSIWYPLNYSEWQHTELLFEDNQPKPAYYAYQFLVQELNQARLEREIPDYPGLRAFEFSAPSKKIWVMWAPDLVNHVISTPANVQHIFDKNGNSIAIESVITVNSPVYLEFAP